MTKRKNLASQVLAVILIFVLVGTSLTPVSAVGAPLDTITFVVLPDKVARQTVEIGTAREQLALPPQLRALAADGSELQVPVAQWEGGYDPKTPGEYHLTPVFGEGYNAGDAALPGITVTVLPADETGEGDDELVKPAASSQASSLAELKTALADAASGDTITITAGFDVNETLTVPVDKILTIQGGDPLPVLRRAVGFTGALFEFAATETKPVPTVTMKDLVLDGNKAVVSAAAPLIALTSADIGFYSNHSGGLALDGVTLQNNKNSGNGGGLCVASSFSLTLAGCVIQNNEAENGGGLFAEGSYDGGLITLAMSDMKILGNRAQNDGGGLYYTNLYSFTPAASLQGLAVENNVAGNRGGGLFLGVPRNSTINLGGSVEGNTAAYGGGVAGIAIGTYSSDDNMVLTLGGTAGAPMRVVNNTATESGGGVYTNSVGTQTGQTIYTLEWEISNTVIQGNTAGVSHGMDAYWAAGTLPRLSGLVQIGAEGQPGGAYVSGWHIEVNSAAPLSEGSWVGLHFPGLNAFTNPETVRLDWAGGAPEAQAGYFHSLTEGYVLEQQTGENSWDSVVWAYDDGAFRSIDYFHSETGNVFHGQYDGSYRQRWVSPDQLYYYMDDNGNLNIVAKPFHDPDRPSFCATDLYIYTVSRTFGHIATREIEHDRTEFGGFYAAPDGYLYLAIGSRNPGKDDAAEVIEIQKLTQDWQLVDSAVITSGQAKGYSTGITVPFDAGAARMVMAGGKLVVHTAREQYEGHQTNIAFEIDPATMDCKMLHDYGWGNYPYVSHSFNQQVATDGTNLYFADHGDASPRSIALTIIPNYTKGERKGKAYRLFNISQSDAYDYNHTGARLTGLEATGSGVLAVGTSSPQGRAIEGVTGADAYQNVYLIWCNKTGSTADFTWLTEFDPNERYPEVSEPRITPVGGDRFAIMYSVTHQTGFSMEYRLVDGRGDILAEKSFQGMAFTPAAAPYFWEDTLLWVERTHAMAMDLRDPLNPVMLKHPIPLESFELNKSTLTMRRGGTARLILTQCTPPMGGEVSEGWSSTAPGVATVADGLVTAVAPGTAQIQYTNGAITKACEVTVTPELVSMAFDPAPLTLSEGQRHTLVVSPTPGDALLPDDLALFVTTGEGDVVTLKDGVMRAVGTGTATVRATGAIPGNGNSPFTAECTVTVLPPPARVKLAPVALTMHPDDTATLTAEVEPAEAPRAVTWRSGDDGIATVETTGEATATVTAVADGTVSIFATTADGSVTGYCRVTVASHRETLSIARTRLVLVDDFSDSFMLTASDPGANLKYTLRKAESYEAVADYTTVLGIDDDGPVVGNERPITLTPVTGGEGQYILHIAYDNARLGRAWVECRVDVFTTTSVSEDFPTYRLDPKAVTVSSRRTPGATAAQFGLWPNADAEAPVSLMGSGITLQFKDTADGPHPGNSFFDLVPSDENTVDVRIKKTGGIAKKYQGELELQLNGRPVPVSGTLVINVNSKVPVIKAAKVTVNTFWDDNTAELNITGGAVEQFKEADNNTVGWARVVGTLPAWEIEVDDGAKGKSGTLKLLALVEGWGTKGTTEQRADVAENWVKVNVAVKRVITPPALKLQSSKLALYMDEGRAADHTLVLVPKASGETLAGLGVTGIEVDPDSAKSTANGGAFSIKNNYMDVTSGRFTVQAIRSKPEKELKGTLPLLVTLAGGTRKVKLNVSVSLVSDKTVVKLKAGKSAVMLNPNLTEGESYSIPLSTNVAGFDLSAWHEEYPIGVLVYDSKDAKKTDINGQAGKIKAGVSEDGSLLTVSVGRGDASDYFGKTYKVQLTLPQVNAKSPISPTLTLTVKTTKQSTSDQPTAKGYFGPKATISVKGKVDLSTGAKATLTARLTNYNGGVPGDTVFVVIPSKSVGGSAWELRENEHSDNFLIRRTSDYNWTVGLAPNGSLVPGSYTIAIKSGKINNTDTVTAKAVKLTVSAAKPKVTLSTKKVTLYNNDPGSRGLVTLSLPSGYTDILDVTMKGAKVKDSQSGLMVDNPNFPYTIHQLDGNTYAILLDQTKDNAVLDGVRKSGTVTLEIWLRGSGGAKPVTTVKLTVVVNK